jgi:hypothetical protein
MLGCQTTPPMVSQDTLYPFLLEFGVYDLRIFHMPPERGMWCDYGDIPP